MLNANAVSESIENIWQLSHQSSISWAWCFILWKSPYRTWLRLIFLKMNALLHLSACLRACLCACICACLHTFLCACMHACLDACLHACLKKIIRTHTHTSWLLGLLSEPKKIIIFHSLACSGGVNKLTSKRHSLSRKQENTITILCIY